MFGCRQKWGKEVTVGIIGVFDDHGGQEATFLSAIELTKDHHPDRDDERARIQAAGGSVITWELPRVNAMELTGWQPLAADEEYLMVASDGIFESLTANEVRRDLISGWDSHAQRSSVSLAEFIVH
ncbi:hypothetical protein Ddye_015904 [Dipteronia dyeriana]|uniref:PPM-type phosphatase domain-containing protein n=1 Tax=Dipteronia dyeriana TaxID=168575 RepID=A0AAD9U6J3_9ROSI|nr:hypothetical protein Ddye_015904 [Dipteronia dyeriana]